MLLRQDAKVELRVSVALLTFSDKIESPLQKHNRHADKTQKVDCNTRDYLFASSRMLHLAKKRHNET